MSASPHFPRRYLALWLPFLPTDRVRRSMLPAAAEPGERAPLVLVAKTEGTERIVAADPQARARQLEPGLALAAARARVPALRALPADPKADARLLEAIADWADRYTPLVGRDPPHGLILDITGAAHLAGGETTLAADLLARLARAGLAARLGLAPTVGAGWALSRYASGGRAHLADDITRAGLDAALAPLPVAALRIAPETAAALQRVGLKRIGDLIGRPRAALAARFGAALILQLDRARGIDTEAISPRGPVPPAIVEQGFAEPILTETAVVEACRVLARRLAELLTDRGQGATALELAVYRLDGLVKRIAIRLASPCRDAPTLASLLALRLGHLDDPLDPGFGYDLVRLAATTLATKADEARPLAGLGRPCETLPPAVVLAPLIDRLAARFGAPRVIALADTHIPERAARLVPPSARTSPPTDAPLAPRPLRLFDPPEPVEVMAEVPDGPPIHLRWRRRPLRIVAAEGPERIAPEWWTAAAPGSIAPPLPAPSPRHPASAADRRNGDAPPPREQPARPRLDLAALATRQDASTRDYWRVEDATGRRLWLFREGFYGPHAPRWFVHGLFA